MPDRLYDLPEYEGQDDYLSDLALARIATSVLAKLPHDGFDMPSCQASAKTVTATIAFDRPAGPEQNADTFEAMLRACTVIRTLFANLEAARTALTERAEQDRAACAEVTDIGRGVQP